MGLHFAYLLLNDKVLPFYEAHQLPELRILTDRGTEYCGRPEIHAYQLFLAINDIDILLKGKTRLEELFAEIDARIVREEMRKTQEDSVKIPTKIRRIIKKPQLPKIIAKLFTNHLNNQKSN